MLHTERSLLAGVALALTPFAVALPHDHETSDALTRGAKHPAVVDVTRFVTDRGGAPLPLPAEEDAFFFAVLGDRTGGPAEGVEVLAEAVREINLLEPDLVMTVGDLVEGYCEREQWLAQMREYKEIMDGLLCPWFPVAGNHDIYWRGPNRPPEEHERDYEMFFGPLWYAFEHKDCWFIVLYSDEGDPATGERNFEKPACQVMSDAQIAWLDQALERARDARHAFVFLHHPRWLGGQYGDDWERVHRRLVAVGNVRAVFAGHIHHMRYDGVRDGIEYVTLATTGGSQTGKVPEAGFLHHYHTVTVRHDQIALAALPVGHVMDVRAITGTVSEETARLADARPEFDTGIRLARDGSADATVTATVSNPVGRPVDVTLVPSSDDRRWRFAPDHVHHLLEPGDSFAFVFTAARGDAGIDDTFALPVLDVRMDYLAPDARFPIPDRAFELPLTPELPRPAPPRAEQVVHLDGASCLAVRDDQIALPDGPFTVECWLRGERFPAGTSVVSKTESSEFGLAVGDGVPAFWCHLDKAYAVARAQTLVLEPGRWHHLAGVYDGRGTRLYVDGRLAARADRNGPRTRNGLPLLVGAEVAGRGRDTSHFVGQIDGVRLSSVARYVSERFDPGRRHEPDGETVLLLEMDGRTGPWVHDGSAHGAHATVRGAATLGPAAR